jgi:hypothetical protein
VRCEDRGGPAPHGASAVDDRHIVPEGRRKPDNIFLLQRGEMFA